MGRLIAYIIFLWFIIPSLYSRDSTALGPDTAFKQLSISLDEAAPGTKTGICNEQLQSPVLVRVTDEFGVPVDGIQVSFRIIYQPDQAKGAGLSHQIITSDSTGHAQTELILGSKPGAYRVSCRIREGFPDNEVIFQATANRRNWILMLTIGLFGGLGLFLFGMHTMSEGMQQSAGERMRSILENVTRNRIVGAGIGTVVTTIIQSSSATSVMLVSFVNAKLLQFRQTIPVLLGAAIGTTITAQMIAFKITEYSLLLVAVGFFMQAFSKKEQLKSVGYSLFGFGVLFFGMQIMSDAMAPIREWTPFIELMLKLENPLLGILVGAAFTALIQSSSAFIGIMIVLASQGLISLDASIPLLLGSNLGTPVTALLSSLKAGREAKKVALAFLIIKLISVFIFVGWTVQLGKILLQLTPEASLPRLIANAHTFINIVLMIVVLPVTPKVASLVDWIMGRTKEHEKISFTTLYLDHSMITTPSLALNLAKQEIIRMGMIVRTMLSLVLHPFLDKDASSLNPVYIHEKEVNYLRDTIKDYLLGISRESVNSKRVNESFQMLYSLNEFEKIADIISGGLANRAEKWAVKDYEFSKDGKKDLVEFHQKIEKQLKRALVVFEETNLQKAAKMKSKHKEYRSLSQELEKQHYARILEGMKESIESSKTHLEILALLSSIDSHITNIARIALDWNQKAT
ncbi:MAG: Na/Pi symporter [Bacteroidales bacterium]|nr:Na/Pi symporter [Bacteroidales bacterium]